MTLRSVFCTSRGTVNSEVSAAHREVEFWVEVVQLSPDPVQRFCCAVVTKARVWNLALLVRLGQARGQMPYFSERCSVHGQRLCLGDSAKQLEGGTGFVCWVMWNKIFLWVTSGDSMRQAQEEGTCFSLFRNLRTTLNWVCCDEVSKQLCSPQSAILGVCGVSMGTASAQVE